MDSGALSCSPGSSVSRIAQATEQLWIEGAEEARGRTARRATKFALRSITEAMRSTEPGPGGRVIPFRRAQDAPVTTPRTDVRLLDRVRVALRTLHYSTRTEKASVGWIRRFIIFHGKRHPETMGAAEIGAFLSSLATEAKVAASTQNQALAALLFLYQEVLRHELRGSAISSMPSVPRTRLWCSRPLRRRPASARSASIPRQGTSISNGARSLSGAERPE